jgi:hypothetical protein
LIAMPRPGVKPSAAPKRNGGALAHEWVDVPDVPYAGEAPDLPTEVAWQLQTRRWWDTVCRMPHCALWTEAEWRVALETAYVADAFYSGKTTTASELRRRECALGMTLDARRDLRIRYVPVEEFGEPAAAGLPTRQDPRARLRVLNGGDGAA